MAKRKTHKQTRFLQGEVKRLESELKRLKKSKNLDKDEKEYNDEGDEVELTMSPCIFCDNGIMVEIEVVGRIFKKCESCGRTKKV